MKKKNDLNETHGDEMNYKKECGDELEVETYSPHELKSKKRNIVARVAIAGVVVVVSQIALAGDVGDPTSWLRSSGLSIRGSTRSQAAISSSPSASPAIAPSDTRTAVLLDADAVVGS